MSKSNLNGRMFEYFIVHEILKRNRNCIVLGNTVKQQERDFSRIGEVDENLIYRFHKASYQIYGWLERKIDIKTIERFSDDYGIKGDVTDIQLTDSESQIVNLSVKNNHKALKHQRPGSLLQQLGFDKNTKEDLVYRNKLNQISNIFLREVNSSYTNVTKFNEVEKLIFPYIYEPVCKLVSETLNQYGTNVDVSNRFQKFLLGYTDFNKIILFNNKIEIQSPTSFPKSIGMKVSTLNKNYVMIDFLNGIRIKMRLHTASSRISSSLSLKFDSQMDESVVIPHIIINL